jgi:hypothetical protein
VPICLRYFMSKTDWKYRIDYSVSQLPASEKWLYVDPEYQDAYPP